MLSPEDSKFVEEIEYWDSKDTTVRLIAIIRKQSLALEKLESGIVYACPDKRFTALEQSREILGSGG